MPSYLVEHGDYCLRYKRPIDPIINKLLDHNKRLYGVYPIKGTVTNTKLNEVPDRIRHTRWSRMRCSRFIKLSSRNCFVRHIMPWYFTGKDLRRCCK